MTQFQPQTISDFNTPRPEKSKGRFWLFGCLGCLGVTVIVVIAIIAGVMWLGTRPAISVQSGSSMPANDLQAIRDAGLIESDEDIELVYTEGLLNFRSDSFFFTDRRVVQYGSVNDPATVFSANFQNVTDIELIKSDSFIEDSTIVITLDDGSQIFGMVNNLDEEDSRFYNAIVAAWREADEGP